MLELVEDLGRIVRESDSSRSDNWGLFRCQCNSITAIRTYDVSIGRTTVCKTCSIAEGIRKRKESARLSIIDKFSSVHGSKFDYSKFTYSSAKIKSIVICREHGEFLITPNNHLSGYGCKQCGITSMIEKQTTEARSSFFADMERLHSGKLQVECAEYVNTHTKVSAKCLVEHCMHSFKITPAKLKSGGGCPKCGYRRIAQTASYHTHKHNYKTKCAIYFIEFPELGLYKLGITNRSVKKRYEREKYVYNELFTLEVATGALAYAVEQQLLKIYTNLRYKGNKLLINGNSECLTENPKDFINVVKATINTLKDIYGCQR